MSTPRHTLPRVLLCLTVCLLSPLLRAQQRIENTLYQFCQQTNCTDGEQPFTGGVVQDSEGNLYGTTFYGGTYGEGVVFELTPPPGGNGPWTETVLYSFCSAAHCADGANPYAGVVFDSRGNLYGTTQSGGSVFDYTHGAAYKLSPPAGGHGPWTETVIYNFCSMTDCPDGEMPESNLIFDGSGNLYGTTSAGGVRGYGMVFKLAPPPGGSGLWTETKLYSFCLLVGCPDGLNPGTANLVFDAQGNLYGTTQFGGDDNDGGIVYRLNPQISPYGLWTETVLHIFCTLCFDGTNPNAGVVFDSHGNLFGTTLSGGQIGFGTIYELSPPPGGSGPWNETILVNLSYATGNETDTPLTPDSNGNFYGNTFVGGTLDGGVGFELSPSGASWSYNILYDFCSLAACGYELSPNSAFLLDHNGNLFSTAGGGAYERGAVIELLAGVPTSTNLVTNPNPSDLDQTVVMTATVTAQNGSIPTGTVIFNDGGSQIGSASLNGSGVAVFSDASLTPVPHTLTAVYQPAPGWLGSTSNAVIQVVNPWYASTTTVSSSPNPSTVGQSVTFTASVGPSGSPYPTGTVSFTADGAPISGCTGLRLSYSLQVTCTTSSVPVGMNSIVASYSGDNNYGPSSGSMWQIVNPVPTPLQFITVAPCRLVDTRPQKGGSGPIQGGTAESFPVPQLGGCNIPGTAVAFSLNVTAIPNGSLGYLTVWPTGENRPGVSILNSPDGRTKANAAMVAAGTNGAVSVYASDTTNLALDINGYFVTTGSLPGEQTLQFYTLTPCRVVDTRTPDGPLGGPFLAAQAERDFPLPDSSCIPPGSNPQAYSLNFTAVPHPSGQQLGYLTVWPQGGTKPLVSTLNNPTGTIVANAAVVPAGSGGGIAVYPDQNTDLVIDINGYFAAPGGQNGLSLYVLAPCRVLDTRTVGNGQPFTGQLTINVASSACAPPATAQAYVFNATALPSGNLSYLTLWPDGEGQPVVSTLNAADGWITSNMAIVPNHGDGKIDAYAAGVTQLILDISSYFAP